MPLNLRRNVSTFLLFFRLFAMLVTVQYPVVDCRGFVSGESHKLVKPYFANPSPDEFMRNFGRVGRRGLSYRDYCRNEDIFCHADNAVRMPAMSPVADGVVAARARSRIFSNGGNLYRVEVRMEVYAAEGVAWPDDLLQRMAMLPLRVRGEDGRYVERRVADAGCALAQLYLRSTTSAAHLAEVRRHWVSVGEPVMMVETCGACEQPFTTAAAEVTGPWSEWCGLSFCRVTPAVPPARQNMPPAVCGVSGTAGKGRARRPSSRSSAAHDAVGDEPLPGMACWVVSRRDMVTGSHRIPVLRTLLFRIHGEKQGLLLTARFISMASGGAGEGINAARARGYVAGTLDSLLRNRRFNMPQGEIVDYAFAIDNSHAREDYERILEVVRLWQDQFMEEDLVLLFRKIDYDRIINDIVALPDYYVNTFWHDMVSRLRQRNKVGVKSLLRKSRPLVEALARDMATGAIINMLLGG